MSVFSFCYPILLWGFDHRSLQQSSFFFEKIKACGIDKLSSIVSSKHENFCFKLCFDHIVKLNEGRSNLILTVQQLNASASTEIINKCEKEVSCSDVGSSVRTLKVHMNKLKRRLSGNRAFIEGKSM